ncbi:MAG TPA: hypothetical protein VL961_09015, partial [Acidimicrobiales bacterium]|nr:hypothetical protein [Acidimicrobiales bacterium]
MSTGPKTRVHGRWRWYAPHRAIILSGVVLTLIALGGAFLGVANASKAESATAQLNQRYLVLLPPLRAIRASSANFQVLAAEVFNNTVAPDVVLPEAESDTTTMNKDYDTLRHLLATSGDDNLAPGLTGRMAAFQTAQDSLGAFLAGQRQTAVTAHLSAVETSAYTRLDLTLAGAQTDITDRLEATADQAHAAADQARVDLLWSILIGVLIAG